MLSEKEAERLIEECLTAYHKGASNYEHLMDRATMELSDTQWERLEGLLKPLKITDALEILADGHAIMAIHSAQKVCEAVQVDFDEKLVMRWKNRDEALRTYGFFAMSNEPGAGVDGLDLSYYVAEQLGLGRPGGAFTGKGFQAQANSRAIALFLSKAGKA